MTIRRKILGLALLAALFVGGCGYHPVTLRGPLAEANGVNVIMFANKSYRSGLSGTLTRNLIDELALRTEGRVLPGDQAQLELTGAIISYGTSPVSYTSTDTIKEYKIEIQVEATLQEKHTQKVLWKGKLTGSQVFPVNSNIALQQNAEEAAIQQACHRLAEEIWQKISVSF